MCYLADNFIVYNTTTMNKALAILCFIFAAQFSFSQEKVNDSISIQQKTLIEACFENIDNSSEKDVKIYYESYLVKYREDPSEFNKKVLEYLKKKIKEN
tara:strand:- start:768 stop:1064 length:297 start_codon:yes stop_codon:yes gene_type:complete